MLKEALEEVVNESGKGYWMPGSGCLRAEGENRPSRPGHCVVQPVGAFKYGNSAQARSIGYSEKVAPTLQGGEGGNQKPVVCHPIVFQACGDRNNPGISTSEKAYCVPANPMSDREIVAHPHNRKYIIRRLTPLECCRLQGFPDWWENGVQGSDSARYKMWGNGIALPNAEYVIGCAKRLKQGEHYGQGHDGLREVEE